MAVPDLALYHCLPVPLPCPVTARSAHTMNPITIRPLGLNDVAPMRDMLCMFGKAFDDIATYTARQPNDAYLE